MKCSSKYGDGHFMKFNWNAIIQNFDVSIHYQWASLFVLHMHLEYQIFTYNNASFDNFLTMKKYIVH